MSVFHKESVKVSSIKKNNIFNEKTKFNFTTSQCCIVLGLRELRVKLNFTQLHRASLCLRPHPYPPLKREGTIVSHHKY